jgi:hypothetical protein
LQTSSTALSNLRSGTQEPTVAVAGGSLVATIDGTSEGAHGAPRGVTGI